MEHCSNYQCSWAADRGTPSRMHKKTMIAPDKERAADKQCPREGKF